MKAYLIEKLRIFRLLLHKSYLVRVRHWKSSIIGEIAVPILLFAFVWNAGKISSEPERHPKDTYFPKSSVDELLGHPVNESDDDYPYYPFAYVHYAPANDFTNELMSDVRGCLKGYFGLKDHKTENHFMMHHHTTYMRDEAAVIFDKSMDRSSKHLRYKILTHQGIGSSLMLYHGRTQRNFAEYFYTNQYPIVQIQYCLGRAFVGLKNKQKLGDIPEIFIQEMPYPAFTSHSDFENALREIFTSTLLFILYFPFFVETARTAGEKYTGINVLMAINGVSNTLNLLSWIVSGILFLTVFLVLPILYLLASSAGKGTPYFYYGNKLLLFFVLIFYLAYLIVFGIHVSAYCAKSSSKTTALVMAIIVMIIVEDSLPSSKLHHAPYLGMLFPRILFKSAFREINNYEIRSEGIQWYNLFTCSNPKLKVGSSLGMFFILSMIGMIFNFLLAIYVLAIYPGKYGAGKHPLFFLKRFRPKSQNNDDFIESVEYDDTNRQFFETVPADVYVPGIQIRNLKKEYRTSLFNTEKIHALRGVSVDFYQGQITSLLGHNGAGKTTMMSILTGMTSPTDGLILVNSKNLKDNAFEIMQDMGLCPQEDIYFASLTVSQQIEFFGRLKKKDKSKAVVKQDVRSLLEKFHLSDKADSLPRTLSGGQKRRLCLGMALICDASILILDEPTSGLDPESRRFVWDIFLKMRGHKTILISTHNLEEADVLGDRIAIMHTGQLKCYGSSLFLKRLIGEGNVEVTLSIEPQSDPERIRSELHKDGVIVSRGSGKLVVRIPNSPALPDTLDSLERKKKELGVSGFSVSLISLEQVFLKMTQDIDEPPKVETVDDREEERLTGNELLLHTVRALLWKKLSYTLKTYTNIILKIVLIFLTLLLFATFILVIMMVGMISTEVLPMTLDIYPSPSVFYSSQDKNFARHYKAISENFGVDPVEVTHTNLERALMEHAKDNLAIYDNHMIAAAEFNKTAFNAFFSSVASFSLPISFNLLWNAIVKRLLGSDYSISLSSQQMPSKEMMYLDLSRPIAPWIALFFVIPFCYVVALYVIHPRRENSRDVKHLQLMTGVSGITYWGTMFLFDFLDYIILTALVVYGFSMVDWLLEVKLFEKNEMGVEILLLVVFGINILPFTYIFSFFNKKSSSLVRWLTYLSVGLVFLDFVTYIVSIITENDAYLYAKKVLHLVPCVSFYHCQAAYFVTALTNARCRRLPNEFYDVQCGRARDVCCDMRCYDGKCQVPKRFFDDVDEEAPRAKMEFHLKESFTYLCLTPLLYIALLATIESKIIQKWCLKHCKYGGGGDTAEPFSDEQVENEHAMIDRQIQAILQSSANDGDTIRDEEIPDTEDSPNDRIFLVYELRKSYGRVRAVKDISFAVNRGECFVLLGVNGAGKSTAFRMMTGRELPDHGSIYMEDKDIENNRKYILSMMGYCSQNNAMLECLNCYDHLRLFARLRGIPEDQVESAVESWIERLNLTAYSRQSSRTLSGGNKRRLNIAMALIGNPRMIFMDEPTTGVDPGARRSLWNVIKSCQSAGQSVVLTSHSMEECEALCNRLAIMVDGKLVCIGASEELKQRFGAGYDIQIKIDPRKAADQVDGIKNDMPLTLNCVLIDENLGQLVYHVTPAGTTWRKMYDVMNGMQRKYDCIEEFLVLSASLEQLFLMFARTAATSSTSQMPN